MSNELKLQFALVFYSKRSEIYVTDETKEKNENAVCKKKKV